MRKLDNIPLTIKRPYSLRFSKLDDQITVLNLTHRGETLKVCRGWYRKVVEKGYLDDIDFNIVVVNNKLNPSIPEKL